MKPRSLLIGMGFACADAATPGPLPVLTLAVTSPGPGTTVGALDPVWLSGTAVADDLGLLPPDSVWWTDNGEEVVRGFDGRIWARPGLRAIRFHARFGEREASRLVSLNVAEGELGRVVWTTAVGGDNGVSLAPDGSVIGVDRGVIGSGRSRIASVTPAGGVQWLVELWAAVRSEEPTVGLDGALYLGLYRVPPQNGFAALNQDGSLRWWFRPDQHDSTSTAGQYYSWGGLALDDLGNVYGTTAEIDAPVYSLDIHGNVRWRTETNADGVAQNMYSPVTVVNDSLVVMAGARSTTILSAVDGAMRWRRGVARTFCVSDTPHNDTHLFMVDRDASNLNAHRFDGSVEWSVPITSPQNGSVLVDRDRLVIGSASGWAALDAVTGAVLLATDSAAPLRVSEELTLGANGVVYARGPDSLISWDRFGARRFAVPLHARSAGCGSASTRTGPAIASDGTLYVASGTGILALRDTVGPALDAPWVTFRGNFARTGRRQ